MEPVCVCVSLHHLHLNTYILATGWSSVVSSHCKHTHTIYTRTLTQEATALITDHFRKVCHYFKCRTFLKVHELLKSAFGQNSVIRLKGIPSCACGFLRWIRDTVACVQLSQIASVIFALLSLLSKHVPLLLSSLSTGRGPPLSCAFVVVMCAVTLTLVRVGSHVSLLVETESAPFPLGKVFLHVFLSRLFQLAPPNPRAPFLSVEVMGNLSQVVFQLCKASSQSLQLE